MAFIALTIFAALLHTIALSLLSMFQILRIYFKLKTIFIEMWESGTSTVSKTHVL
jgi:hypothetical protein